MIQFLKALYSLFGFVELIKKQIDLMNAEKKAKEDADKIQDAFKNHDSDALNSVFNELPESKN